VFDLRGFREEVEQLLTAFYTDPWFACVGGHVNAQERSVSGRVVAYRSPCLSR
jgi:hypothetical protein